MFYRSEFLNVVERTDNLYAIYHSLYGNLMYVDASIKDFLDNVYLIPRHGITKELGKPIADALIERYFLVEHPDEERNELERMLSNRAEQIPTGAMLSGLQISASNSCNLACTYCFADVSDDRSDRRSSAGKGNISFDQAKNSIDKVLEIANKHGKHKIAVKFLGREPFMNWKVMLQLFQAYAPEQVHWSVTTNGTIITRDIASKLGEYNVSVVVSLDGPSHINDFYRQYNGSNPTGASSFARAWAGIEKLVHAGVIPEISSVITPSFELPEYLSFIQNLQEKGIRRVECNLLMQADENTGLTSTNSTSLAEHLTELVMRAKELGVELSGDFTAPVERIYTTRKVRSSDAILRLLASSCSASEHQISVEPNGDLYPCRAMSTEYGHIDNLEEVLKSQEYSSVLMRTYGNVPSCNGCALEGHCQGTCLGSSEETEGSIYAVNDWYCGVYRSTTLALMHTMHLPLHIQTHLLASNADKKTAYCPHNNVFYEKNKAINLNVARPISNAIGIPAVGTPAVGTPAVGTPAVGTPAVGTPAVGTPAVGTPAV